MITKHHGLMLPLSNVHESRQKKNRHKTHVNLRLARDLPQMPSQADDSKGQFHDGHAIPINPHPVYGGAPRAVPKHKGNRPDPV